MKNGIVINHSIPLTEEQRHRLVKNPEPIEVIGISVPVWVIDGINEEPTKEVICKYVLSSYKVHCNMVVPDKEGYTINIGTESIDKLLNIREGGIADLVVNETSQIKDGRGDKYIAIHQIHIFDSSVLDSSMEFVRLND
jgi:hypothetical protein